MADYTLTSANVVPSAAASLASCTAGAAINAGQPCYLDSADLDAANRPKAKLADANGNATTATVAGLAVNTAANGQIVNLCSADSNYAHGLASPIVGDIVVLSATAGGLCPASDIASTWRPVVCLVPISATNAILRITNGTAAKS